MKIVGVEEEKREIGRYQTGELTDALILGTHMGFAVAKVGMRQHYFRSEYVQQHYIYSYPINLKDRGRERATIAGKTPSYVRNALKKAIGSDAMAKLCTKTHFKITEDIKGVAQMLIQQIDNETALSSSRALYRYDFEEEDLIELLLLYKEKEQRYDFPPKVRARLDQIYQKYSKHIQAAAEAAEQKKVQFRNPKWILGYAQNISGYYIGTGQFTEDGGLQADREFSLRLYPSLEHYYEKYPDKARSLMASHAFFRTYIQQHDPEKQFVDDKKLVPQGDWAHTTIGAAGWYRSTEPASPQFLIFDKVAC